MRTYWYWPFVRPEELGLAEAFAGRGHELLLQTVAGRVPEGTPTPGFELRSDVAALRARAEGTVRWLASRATAYPARAITRQRTVRHGDFDLAHVVYLNYFTDGLALRALKRTVPIVVTVHDVVPHQGRVPATVERALLRMQYHAAPDVIVHHPSVGERLHAEFGFDRHRIHDVPWAVPEVDVLTKTAPDDLPTVLMFGTLRRNKGIGVLLEALSAVPEAGFRLVVAGRGFADVENEVRAAAARDPRIVAEIGYVSEARKHELYRHSDLVVLPYTTFSSQSAVLHDAYAHHRPVVVCDVGALGHAVRADDTGWVVAPNDSAALGESLVAALASGAEWNHKALAAARIARERSPEAVARVLETVYGRIVKGTRRPPMTE